MSTFAKTPVIVLHVELPEVLHAACDPGRVSAAVADRATRLLTASGLPGRARAQISRARRDNRPLRLVVHGVGCPYPMRMLLSAAAELEVVQPDPLGGRAPVHSPVTWVRWLREQLRAAAAADDAGRWAERFVVWVADAAMNLNPGRLVDVELAAAYAGDRGEAVDPAMLRDVLAALLDLGVSVGDRSTVLGSLGTGARPSVVVEQVFRLLRGNVVKVRVHPDLATGVLRAPGTGDVDVADLGDDEARRQFSYVQEAFRSDLGLPAPAIRIVADPDLVPRGMVVQVHDQRGWPTPGLDHDELLVREPAARLADVGVPGRPMYNPYTGERASAVPERWTEALDAHGIAYWEGSAYLAVAAHLALRRRIWQLIGPGEVELLVSRLRGTEARLAEVLLELYSVTDLACLLRQLVSESVPIVDLAPIAEALVRPDPDSPVDLSAGDRWHAGGVVDRDALVNQVRRALRGVVTGAQSPDGPVPVLRAPRVFEDAVVAAFARERPDDAVLDDLSDQVWSAVEQAVEAGARAVVMTSPAARPAVRRLLDREMPEQPVWATAEIGPDVDVATLPWPDPADAATAAGPTSRYARLVRGTP
jgi:FHIPEP family